MLKRIIESIISALLIFIMTFTINLLLIDKTAPKYSIIISDINQSHDGRFIFSTTIQNNDVNIGKNIMLQIPELIVKDDVISNKPANIEFVNSSKIGTSILVSDFSGNESLNLVFRVDSEFDIKKLKVSTEDSKIKIIYLNETINEKAEYIKRIIFTLLSTSIIYGLINLFFTLNQDKKITIVKENISSLEKQLVLLKEDSKEYKSKYRTEMLVLKKRIKEYDKELNFWKNTIRKLVYNSKNSKQENEQIVDLVTKELRTYQTRCSDHVCLDNIEAMSNSIDLDSNK